MEFTDARSDPAVLEELGRRLARHRLNRNLTQAALARDAGISQRTLVRLESGESTQSTNLIRVLRALDLLGNLEALVSAPAPSPIGRLEQHGKVRRRASPAADRPEETEPWRWDDDA